MKFLLISHSITTFVSSAILSSVQVTALVPPTPPNHGPSPTIEARALMYVHSFINNLTCLFPPRFPIICKHLTSFTQQLELTPAKQNRTNNHALRPDMAHDPPNTLLHRRRRAVHHGLRRSHLRSRALLHFYKIGCIYGSSYRCTASLKFPLQVL